MFGLETLYKTYYNFVRGVAPPFYHLMLEIVYNLNVEENKGPPLYFMASNCENTHTHTHTHTCYIFMNLFMRILCVEKLGLFWMLRTQLGKKKL